MTGWHVTDDLVLRYAQGTARETDSWSLEKHVESCTRCAERVTAVVRDRAAGAAVLDAVRAAVLATAEAEQAPAGAGRRASGAGSAPRTHGRPRFGRVLWAAGPALRGPWAAALLLVVCAAVALAYGGGLGGSARALLLLVAPVLPLTGVGVSYGRSADPLHEIIATSPGGGLRLLLTRTAAVLGVTVPVLALAWAVLPASAGGPGPLAWLLPGLALTLAALGLGSYAGCRTAALVVATGWAAVVTVPAALDRSPSAFLGGTPTALRYFAGLPAQGAWAGAAVLCAALLVIRRRSFDHLETS
ncbi:hypothetical protein FKN01_19800 [Streptomyces sp. 130]|uniref:hypothetical protein n=1 Tax=Streptomyces sp. 130 TaxID=2591006 RepID=UPI00117FD36F|nr:hypothetical protein [Streptomyces sp. 130]TRV76129.1 hypothetical protein FKN01_19800 [Streptomyces sp. 130]